MIDILIPTYNRDSFLKRNIELINEQLKKEGLIEFFNIIVSDNCSVDSTDEVLKELKATVSVNLITYTREENTGLEANALFLLDKAKSNFVMYLGDDDYLPEGYLNFVYMKVSQEKNIGCIIPGFSSLYPDGSVTHSRSALFDLKKYSPSFKTVLEISNFGHQLSGVLVKRDGLYNAYMGNEKNRNIYPFIFFVSFCMLRDYTYYAPKYQVLVSQGNSKDWRYDDSGLLTEVFKNYKIVFPESYLKETASSISFAIKQSWRLRIGLNIVDTFKSFFHLLKSGDVNLLIKSSLFFIYPYCFFKKIIGGLYRKILSK